MELKRVIWFVVLLVVAFLLGFFYDNFSLTGQVVADNSLEVGRNYTWTKAICKDNGDGTKCLDVLVECEEGKVVRLTPVSEIKEFGEDWKDPRGDFSKVYCK
jgi:hypothetical protein